MMKLWQQRSAVQRECMSLTDWSCPGILMTRRSTLHQIIIPPHNEVLNCISRRRLWLWSVCGVELCGSDQQEIFLLLVIEYGQRIPAGRKMALHENKFIIGGSVVFVGPGMQITSALRQPCAGEQSSGNCFYDCIRGKSKNEHHYSTQFTHEGACSYWRFWRRRSGLWRSHTNASV